MPRVEEINRYYNRDTYFTSAVNILSKSNKTSKSNDSRRKRLNAGAYNLNILENQLHGTELTEDLIEEKNSMKRLMEIDTENFNENSRVDLPKTGLSFDYQTTRLPISLSSKPANATTVNAAASGTTTAGENSTVGSSNRIKIKQSYVTPVRKILSSRRTLTNYMDEIDERFHSVLYGIVSKRTRNFIVPNKKLCSICGDASPGSCVKCGSRVCSVQCSVVHNETRCSGY
jgi:zinc finger HIT domain-containing protein 1